MCQTLSYCLHPILITTEKYDLFLYDPREDWRQRGEWTYAMSQLVQRHLLGGIWATPFNPNSSLFSCHRCHSFIQHIWAGGPRVRRTTGNRGSKNWHDLCPRSLKSNRKTINQIVTNKWVVQEFWERMSNCPNGTKINCFSLDLKHHRVYDLRLD